MQISDKLIMELSKTALKYAILLDISYNNNILSFKINSKSYDWGIGKFLSNCFTVLSKYYNITYNKGCFTINDLTNETLFIKRLKKIDNR